MMESATVQNIESPTRREPAPDPVMVLEGIPYGLYVRLRDIKENYHLRMFYHDGTLEIMSPGLRHDRSSRKLGVVVRAVALSFEIACGGCGSTTYRIGEPKKKRGSGAEADEGFYFANEPLIRGKIDLDVRSDPPPDLWIEVDDTARPRRAKSKVLAELGIPELWRYSAAKGTVRFYRKVEDRFEPIDRSLCLPMLTPDRVIEALNLTPDRDETAWLAELLRWAPTIPRA